MGPLLHVRRTRADLGRTVRAAYRDTLAPQVLMQLLLRGQRLGPLEGLLCFSPFACISLLVGVVALELPGLRDGGLTMMAEHPLVFLGQACSEHSHSEHSRSTCPSVEVETQSVAVLPASQQMSYTGSRWEHSMTLVSTGLGPLRVSQKETSPLYSPPTSRSCCLGL